MKRIIVFLVIITSLLADYNQLKIQDFVNIVATQNNINIVTDKPIEKEFDFYINRAISSSTNVDVLRNLLDDNGYILSKQSGNYYIIKSKDDMLINKIEIYKIRYADTQKVKETLENILKGYFRNIKRVRTTQNKKVLTPMEENKNTNRVVMETEETEEKLNYSIDVIDKQYISVTYKDDFVPRVCQKIIKSMDKAPVRIRVSMKIYEVNTNALKDFGMKYGIQNDLSSASLDSSTGEIGINLTNAISNPKALNISMVLQALEKQGDAKITSKPSVLLYEGKRTKLTEGKSYPISTKTTDITSNATTTTTTFQDKDTGLILDIHFKGFRSGMINLDLKFNYTDVENYDAQNKQLITIKRELQTELIIPPSKQIDMAGLTKKANRSTSGGIPIIKEIPWIGRLFEFNHETVEDNMLIIQLQADIIEDKSKLKDIFKKTTSNKPLQGTKKDNLIPKHTQKPPKIPQIIFYPDDFNVPSKSVIELGALAKYMQNNKKVKLEIIGYTDNSGDPELNKELSLYRAESVKNVLVEYGVSTKRIKAKGMGDANPIADNNNVEGRIKNRRIEFKLKM